MTQSVEIAPPHSFVVISDIDGGEIPSGNAVRGMKATSSCILVGCLMFADGPSRFTLCRGAEFASDKQPSFEGSLGTPNRVVAVSTTDGQIILQQQVQDSRTRVRIWTNHPVEPDQVVIGLG